MVKICTECYEVNAGGFRCVDCGGRLILTSDPEAKDLPASVWKNQRVDYGARRGMIMRFMAIFIGAIVGLWGFRASFALDEPYSYIGMVAAILAGLFVWRVLHHAAFRGVRVWVLAKGKVRRGRLARAILLGLIPWRRRRRAAR